MYKILLLLIVFCGIGGYQAMASEEPPFQIVKQEDSFQLRDYEPYAIVAIQVHSSKEEAGSMAFRPLFRYISGENMAQNEYAMTAPVGQVEANRSTKLPMTVPVGQQSIDAKGTHKVFFILPHGVTAVAAPKPNDDRLWLEQMPARRVAAITYSGRSSIKNFEKNTEKLQAWIKANQWQAVGEPIFATYNPPWTPWFARRNEVLIQVKK